MKTENNKNTRKRIFAIFLLIVGLTITLPVYDDEGWKEPAEVLATSNAGGNSSGGSSSGGGSTSAVTDITGCAVQPSTNYSSGFPATNFDFVNVGTDSGTGALSLQTGMQAIDPNKIVIPFDQEVSVTFIYDGAGYNNTDFGWFFAKDVILKSPAPATKMGTVVDFTAMQNNTDTTKRPKELYQNIQDNNYAYNSGNELLDNLEGTYPNPKCSTMGKADIPGDLNCDGAVNTLDNTVSLTPNGGKIPGGMELVFYIKVDDQKQPDGSTSVYFTKTAWNPDCYGTNTTKGSIKGSNNKPLLEFDKTYQLGTAGGESYVQSGGWMTQTAIDRIKKYFNVTLTGSYVMHVKVGEKYPHFIVGAPPTDPNQWILGVDDQFGDGIGGAYSGGTATTPCDSTFSNYPACSRGVSDMDHNDMVFRINRKTGGMVGLKADALVGGTITGNAIVPNGCDRNSLSTCASAFSGATLKVWDYMPSAGVCAGKTEIDYSVSPDNGATWISIAAWDQVYTSSATKTIGTKVTGWTPGYPEYTYRTVKIDFASSGKLGKEFLWKASLISGDDNCVPKILNVALDFSVTQHGFFARSSPVAQVNVMYAGSYETPPFTDGSTDMSLRGHLTATSLYDPADPSKTSVSKIWDAGAVTSAMSVDSRKIYFPQTTTVKVTNKQLGTGDGVTKSFTLTITDVPIQAGSVVATDGLETFTDLVDGTMKPQMYFQSNGTIDRSNGELKLNFYNAPYDKTPIKVSYNYYSTNQNMTEFKPPNVTPAMLNLTADWIYDYTGKQNYLNDFNKSCYGLATCTIDQNDANWLVNWVRGYSDGVSTKKKWLLGPIDHSTPAVDIAPGKPAWYFGSALKDEERKAYDAFILQYIDKPAVVYAGSRDGMLHAFDGGLFRWGDNPKTADVQEVLGYFNWSGSTSATAQYGTGSELWAFIPVDLLSRLKNNYLGTGDPAYVDASPAVADVFIKGAWKSILISAEGDGGSTVFCLDVTDPKASTGPKFLWEYQDNDLYWSKSSPSIAKIGKIKHAGETVWVAFFVSGKTADGQFPSIFIIDIGTGALLQRIYLTTDYTDSKNGVPSGQPAVIDFDGDGIVDRLYIGTNKGFLYKINLFADGSVPTICVLNSTVASPNQPIYGTPAVLVDRHYDSSSNVVERTLIFYGTGDNPYESDSDPNALYYFYAFEDKDQNGACSEITSGPLWKYQLPAKEKVWTSAFASAGKLYFGTTTQDTEDPCENYGSTTGAHLYVFDQTATSSTTPTPLNKIASPNISVAPLVDDAHLYIRYPDGAIESYGAAGYNTPKKNYGLPQIKVKSWREIY